jgi:5-methylcytosine-specific restriction endonuclease McrA
MATYAEKLRDPRWQKKRLEVMQRASFTCEGCGCSDKTLHVHHGYYIPGNDPWDYRDETLWCLCEACHEEAEDWRLDLYAELALINPRHLSPNMAFDFQSKEDVDRMVAINQKYAWKLKRFQEGT